MPIDRAQVPILIKNSQLKKIDNWKRDYFEKIAKAIQVHTKGQLFAKVDTLFPNEHPDSRAHCIATYEPITKSSIWKGINNLHRIFSSSSFSINVGDELREWLEDYEYDGHNLVNHFLQEWIHKAIAEDPNGLFVIYPPDYADRVGICPIQWVRSELIRSRTREAISFVSEIDSEVTYHYENAVTKREVFYDPSTESMNARTFTQTTYNERLKVKIVKEVVHVFTLDGFIIYSTQRGNEPTPQTIVDFAEPLTQMPVFTGGGFVCDKADQVLYESFVQQFVPFGNLALLQHRNHRAVDLQFSYPRMSELQVPCDYKGCSAGKVKCRKSNQTPDGFMDCPQCKGKAFVVIQSPYKVYNPRYDPNDNNENKHLNIDPVKFFSPDVGIIEYSKDAWRDYLKMAEESIFVTQKVMTGQVQSEESKHLDLDDLYAWLLSVSKFFYNNLRIILQSLEDYIAKSPTTVAVQRPYSFAILTEAEAFQTLNNILTSTAPVFIRANEVDNFVSKFVSKDSPVIRSLAILKQYDPLLFYSNGEVQQFKSSSGISRDMYIKHILAYPMMLKLYMEDKNFLFQEDAPIMSQLDNEISALNIADAATGDNFRKTIIDKLGAAA